MLQCSGFWKIWVLNSLNLNRLCGDLLKRRRCSTSIIIIVMYISLYWSSVDCFCVNISSWGNKSCSREVGNQHGARDRPQTKLHSRFWGIWIICLAWNRRLPVQGTLLGVPYSRHPVRVALFIPFELPYSRSPARVKAPLLEVSSALVLLFTLEWYHGSMTGLIVKHLNFARICQISASVQA